MATTHENVGTQGGLRDINCDPSGERPPVMSEAERARILYEWNDTRVQYPTVCAHQLFEQQVERSPDAVAVICKDRQLTYRELNERANQVAHFLRKSGVGAETLVGVCLERSPELVFGLLGVWKAGGAYVPLDPAYPAERLSFMVSDAALRILLTEHKCKDLFSSAGVKVLCLDDDWPGISDESTVNPCAAAIPSNLAYVMYTSGSTGQPKGAMILHSGLVNYLCWAIESYAVDSSGSVPVHSSIAFDLTVTSLYPALLAGGQIELLAEDVGAQNLLAALRERRIRSLVKITPAHLDVLTHQLRPEELAGLTKTFVIGGENLPAESLSLWRDLAPNSRLINEYGPTETVVGCCVHEVSPADPRNGPVPIGRPIANTQLYVLDAEMQPVPTGIMGELYIGGAGVARGYLNRPELTQEKFLPDQFSHGVGARLYRTGDLARYRVDGTLEFLGRVDNQVKVRGYRIELGEIEAALASHPAIQSCAVVAREDTTANKQLIAYVVPRGGQMPEGDEVQTFLMQRLPEYMVPAHVVFLDSLPLTLNGKVDRNLLPPPFSVSNSSRKFTAARNETETSIATIWSDLLKIDNIGVDDDFFELGGHSLLAIRALARIRDVFGVDLSPQTLFENSTLAAVAALVTDAKGELKDLKQIPPRTKDGPCSVSFAQEQLWLLDQLVPCSPAYNIVDVIPISGDYDAKALKRAFNELVSRHEILRTAFSRADGQLMQSVVPSFEPELAEFDLRTASEDERQREWVRLVREQGRAPFDLSRVPLFRARIVHTTATQHKVLLTIHHIIADEWSMEIIQKELAELYVAFSSGKPSPLEPLLLQYAAYAMWQREWLQGDVLRGQIDYWKNELNGAVPILVLPADKARPATPTLRGATETFELPKGLMAQLQTIGRQEQATQFMMLEAAFAVLLYRYTGQDDILVGTPISGRTQTETQRLVGCFLNTVVLRTQFNDDLSFRALLRQVRARALGAYTHAELPFERLVAELSPDRDPGRTPIFQVMFILHSRDGVSQVSKISGNHELETGTSKFDLTLFISETDNGLEGLIEYSTDLFEAATIRRLCRSYGQLLGAIASNPEQKISRLPMVADADRRQLVLDWNNTELEFGQPSQCLHELFVRQAARTPDRVSVVFERETLTYGELSSRSDQLARHLTSLGVGPDMLVGLLVERSLEMMVGLLGIMKAGGAYVPLDPSFPPDRLAYVIEDAQMQVLVTHRRLDETLRLHCSTVVYLDSQWDELVKGGREPLVPVGVNPEHLAYVLYTSGSTGMPKGVAIPHSAIVNFLLSMQREPGFSEKDTLLAVTTLSFDIAGLELYLPWVTGAKVVIASREDVVDPHRLMICLRDNACTFMQATPATWRSLIDAGWNGSSRLKVLCGGEAMPHDLAQALLARCAELWNMYGPTETTVWSTVQQVSAASAAQPPIGHPIANTQVYVLDAHGELVPPGAIGELYIGGRGLARGYLHREELTRERFVPSPFVSNARLYRTGDLARWRVDGRLECLGRTDHQVKIRGYRIELGEIEACIARHPDIIQVIVVAREDISGDKRLVAYYVSSHPSPDLVDQLRALLRAAVPEYMVPAHFVSLDALPLTPNGKVDRKVLPAPSTADIRSRSDSYAAPRTELEIGLSDVWQRVLGIERVGINDNFFDLGGHSMLAVMLMSEIKRRLSVEIPLSRIIQCPTIELLADSISTNQLLSVRGRTKAEVSSQIVELRIGGPKFFFFVHDGEGETLLYWNLAKRMSTEFSVYGILPRQLPKIPLAHLRVGDMAACYVEELLRRQAAGPYYLGGLCAGGVIAFEMASQLEKLGHAVELVVMLDAVEPTARLNRFMITRRRISRIRATMELNRKIPGTDETREVTVSQDSDGNENGANVLIQLMRKFRNATGYEVESRVRFVGVWLRLKLLHQVLKRGWEWPDAVPPLKAQEIYMHARITFKSTVSSIRNVLLVKASEGDKGDGPVRQSTSDPLLGWGPLVKGNLVTIDTPGGHSSMLQEPYVDSLAERINGYL